MLKCVRHWLSYDLHPDTVAQIPAAYPDLIKLIFDLKPELCRNQAKCISSLIMSTAGKQISPALETAKQNIGLKVTSLVSSLDRVIESKNENLIRGFQTIFTTLCRTYIDKVLEDTSSELYIVMLKLLRCSKDRNEDICMFWKLLFKEIYGIKDMKIKVEKVVALKAIISELVLTCLAKSQLSDEIFMELNKKSDNDEEFAELVDQRFCYGGILKYIGACIGARNFWTVISGRVKTDFDNIGANPGVPANWASLESTLFCISELLICKLMNLCLR